MKKLSLLSIIVFLSIYCCTVYANNQEKDLYLTCTFPASSIQEVEATTMGGSLTLTGDANSEAKVEVYASRNNWSSEKIKKTIEENYSIDIKVENGKLLAIAKLKKNITNWDEQGLSISFKISVSKQANSYLKTSGGSIKINDISGSHDFKTSGGSLLVENVSGNIVGKTSGGSITVAKSKDNIDLKTSGGSIIARDCSGKIDLGTSGGSVNISNLNGTINAMTSGGSISARDIKGTFKTGTSGGSVKLDNISGNLETHTSGGSMDVKVSSVSDYIKLSNSGYISLTLPAGKGYNLNVKANKIETVYNKGFNFNGQSDDYSMNGTLNGGGSEINVKSSQRVRLSFE